MAWPIATDYIYVIRSDHTLVNATDSHFLCQIDMSDVLAANADFKSCIATSDNITVYDPLTDTVRPKSVYLNLGANRLCINFNAEISSALDRDFYVCVGLGLSYTDHSSAYSDDGYINYYTADADAGPTVYDRVSGNNGTMVGATISYQQGTFGRELRTTDQNSYVLLAGMPMMSGASVLTIEMILKYVGAIKESFFVYYKDANNCFYMEYNAVPAVFYVVIRSLGNVWNGLLNNAWFGLGRNHMILTFDPANPNPAIRFAAYINGSTYFPVTAGTMPNPFPNLIGAPDCYFGHDTAGWSYQGAIDEVGFNWTLKTGNWALTRYNQFYDAGFWTKIDPPAMTAEFSYIPATVYLGDEVTFINESVGMIIESVWSFGYGGYTSTVSGAGNATHRFIRVGTFTVRLNVGSWVGAEVYVEHNVTVVAKIPEVTFGPAKGPTALRVDFSVDMVEP